jgi:hypothetical protein
MMVSGGASQKLILERCSTELGSERLSGLLGDAEAAITLR